MSAKYLIFIDTNILLDFYRVRGHESSLSILRHIDDNLDRFITTNQVEMEFKKNRQRVIIDAHATFKLPGFEGLKLPAFISESKQSKALAHNQQQLKSYAGMLKARMTSVLKNPTTHDPVFKTAHRLFRARSDYNLTPEKKIRFKIRKLAKKRFILGYPPRKGDDTSIGDAINWEWIVHCASESGCHVVIVTRDSDYGVFFDKQPIVNDWLTTEFRERVSKKRKLLLTDRLSTALKLAAIPVTSKEVATERALISARRATAPKPVSLMEALRRSFDTLSYDERPDEQSYDDEPRDEGPPDDGPDEEPPDDGPDEEPPDDGPDEEPPDDGPDEEPPDDGPDEEPPDDGPDEEPPDDEPHDDEPHEPI